MIKRLLAAALLSFGLINISYADEIVGIDGKCLDVEGHNSADGSRIILWPCHREANQRWSYSRGAIKGLAGKCLTIAADGQSTILMPCKKQDNQRWEIVNHEIRSHDGRCLDVNGGGSANGTNIIVWQCHGRPNQRWEIR